MVRHLNKYLEANILQLQQAMDEGLINAQDLVEFYIEQIKKYDVKLKSILTINPDAFNRALELDFERRNNGPRTPLHGIPLILKDNINTKDLPTTYGSINFKDFMPPENAAVVEKLREAGAIILAKANLHEFARGGNTVSSLGGQTCNPYDLQRTPGGSSGGTGVAVAANFAVAGIGTDTINSLRSPASANCIVGLKPTAGLISKQGIFPNSLTLDTVGPMARNVSDIAILLDVLADAVLDETGDLQSSPKSYTNYLMKTGLTNYRIGILKNFFGSDEKSIEANKIINLALEKMKCFGATTIELSLPWLQSGEDLRNMYNLQPFESKDNINEFLNSLGPQAPLKTFEELVNSKNYHPSIRQSLQQAGKKFLSSNEYNKVLDKIRELQKKVLNVMEKNAIDVFAYPHQTQLVSCIGEPQRNRNGILGAITGFPSNVLPAGFSIKSNTAPIGVPIGIELLGKPWSEPLLIKIAYSFEQNNPIRKPPKLFIEKETY